MTTLTLGQVSLTQIDWYNQKKTCLGAIAQLVEHLHGMQGVSGSSPLGSIRILASYTY